MGIAGERLQLRLWAPGDETALVQLADNRNIWRNLTNRFPHPYTHKDAAAWISESNQRPQDAKHCSVLLAGEIVGGVGFDRQDDLRARTAEIGYWVGEQYWGQGIATESLLLATELAFRDYDFVRLQAGVLEWNPASCRVLEKAGYRLEARLRQQGFKDGEICDMLMYALLRADYPAALYL